MRQRLLMVPGNVRLSSYTPGFLWSSHSPHLVNATAQIRIPGCRNVRQDQIGDFVYTLTIYGSDLAEQAALTVGGRSYMPFRHISVVL